MRDIEDRITAMCPSCYGNFFNSLGESTIFQIFNDYTERENDLNYYIKLIKEIYKTYNTAPFKQQKGDEPSLYPDYSDKVMQRRNRIIEEFRQYGVTKNLESCIEDYVDRRRNNYFDGDINYQYSDYLDEYLYFQGLDHLISKIKTLVEKEMDYHRKKGEKTSIKEILKRYISTLFPHQNKTEAFSDEKETPHDEEEYFYTNSELLETGLLPDEVPDNSYHEISDFLGPKGPNL